jgi:hypothetical protein
VRATRRPWTPTRPRSTESLCRFARKDVKGSKKLRHERREATFEKVQVKRRELRERLGHPVQQ